MFYTLDLAVRFLEVQLSYVLKVFVGILRICMLDNHRHDSGAA